jgi:hypothetical protein
MASGGFSILLALAISPAPGGRGSAKSKGIDGTPGEGECRLGRHQNPRRTAKAWLYYRGTNRRPIFASPRPAWGCRSEVARVSTESREVVAAFEFFTVPTVTIRLPYCFFVIEHKRRKILHCNVKQHRGSDGLLEGCQLTARFIKKRIAASLGFGSARVAGGRSKVMGQCI